jgi:hypothetical protein
MWLSTAELSFCRWLLDRAMRRPAIARPLLGIVEAPDADAAIARAVEEFRIEPQRQNRLIAVRRP